MNYGDISEINNMIEHISDLFPLAMEWKLLQP